MSARPGPGPASARRCDGLKPRKTGLHRACCSRLAGWCVRRIKLRSITKDFEPKPDAAATTAAAAATTTGASQRCVAADMGRHGCGGMGANPQLEPSFDGQRCCVGLEPSAADWDSASACRHVSKCIAAYPPDGRRRGVHRHRLSGLEARTAEDFQPNVWNAVHTDLASSH